MLRTRRLQEITPEETVEEDYQSHVDLARQGRICFMVRSMMSTLVLGLCAFRPRPCEELEYRTELIRLVNPHQISIFMVYVIWFFFCWFIFVYGAS